jgi:hypothetical protein
MSESSHEPNERHRERPPEGPTIVREDQVIQASEVANLPHSEDPIEEAAEESFPASDPPAFTGRRQERLAGDNDAEA